MNRNETLKSEDLPSRLAGCVRYAKNKKTVSAESGNITFMLANKTFFFSRWTHNSFVPRKRAKWKATSQWLSYDTARAEHFDSFPDYFNEVSSICSHFLKPFCLFRQKMSLHVEVVRSFDRKSRCMKETHQVFQSTSFYTTTLVLYTCRFLALAFKHHFTERLEN